MLGFEGHFLKRFESIKTQTWLGDKRASRVGLVTETKMT